MLKERDLIALIASRRAGASARSGDLGIGDDCAVLRVDGRSMLVTIDLMVEGIHFDLSYTSPYLLGRKAVAASLSDIAAMGGTPRAIFVSIAIPRKKSASFAKALIEGIHDEARAAKTAVLGGDTSASSGPVLVDVAAVGEAGRGGPILRSGAKAGDLVFVSGALGGSARGLELLDAGFRPWSRRFWSKSLVAAGSKADERRLDLLAALAHLLPKPRLVLGSMLAKNRLATAMIDVSDGLATDLHSLCEASRVGAEIEELAIPVHESVQGLSSSTGRTKRGAKSGGLGARRRRATEDRRLELRNAEEDKVRVTRGLTSRARRLVLAGGEDYELLFTVPPGKETRLRRAARGQDVPLTRIGRIMTARKGIVLVGPGGVRRALAREGYEHFK